MTHGPSSRHRPRRPFDNGTLRLLALQMIARAPRHGYEIIKALEERSAGTYRPSPGVIYPTLAWLEDQGYIHSQVTDGKKKLCSITAAGEAWLDANSATLRDLSSGGPRGGRYWRSRAPSEVAEAMDGFKSTLRRAFETELSPDAVHAIATAITQAARSIETHLAQPDGRTPPSATALQTDTPMDQIITRHRHELHRRELTVRDVTQLTPHMLRITLEGNDLSNFVSLGFDDHLKLFLGSAEAPEMREYTPRAFDTEAGTLTLDFAIHDAGPATQWALDAKPGTTLRLGGPRGSMVISSDMDWHLLIGDETALPAIGRRAEELEAGQRVITLAAVVDEAEHQVFDAVASVESHWVHRPLSAAADPAPLLAAAEALPLPEGRGFIWIAAEARVARALRDAFIARGHPKELLKAAGYWTEGQADAADKALD